MDPRLLTEVEIPEAWRGYNREAVDELLERAAAALGDLQGRLQEATERASAAERRLLERTDEDELRRTLVLAQRTAAAAVEEAKAEAERVVAEAEQQARQISIEAEARVANLESDRAERRTALEADVSALSSFVEEHRARLKAELERQLAQLDAEGLRLPELPALQVAWAPPEAPIAPQPFVPRAPTDEEVAQAREDLVEALRRAGVDELLAAAQETIPAGPEAALEPDVDVDLEVEVEVEAPRLYDAADESGELALDAPEAVTWNEPVTDDDDPFLAELRRAVTDTEPLGPRDDDDLASMFSSDEEAVPSGRFRLRRSR
jgi:cell division septum initiation protein DivIVA